MRRLYLFSALLFSLATPTQAQDGPETPFVPFGQAPAAWRNSIRQLQSEGAWEESIRLANTQLSSSQATGRYQQSLLFSRATAAFALGQLEAAQADLEQLKDSPRAGTAVPSLLERIRRMRANLGSTVQEIKSGDKVLFRVFFEPGDARATAILEQLLPAYEANRHLLYPELSEVPVFIFNSPEKYRTFRQTQYPEAPLLSSQWASGGIAGMCFAPERLAGNRAPDINSSLFKTTIAHEFNHVLVGRRLGNGSIPMWLFEGLAQQVESEMEPTLTIGWNRRLTRIANSGHVVLPRSLETQADWTKAAEEGYRATSQLKPGPDPYAQSWQLTSLFLKMVPLQSLPLFLEELRAGDFDSSLKKFARQSRDDFYAQYLDAAKRMARN